MELGSLSDVMLNLELSPCLKLWRSDHEQGRKWSVTRHLSVSPPEARRSSGRSSRELSRPEIAQSHKRGHDASSLPTRLTHITAYTYISCVGVRLRVGTEILEVMQVAVVSIHFRKDHHWS